MEREARTAAKWWADQLRDQPQHDNGDALGSAFAGLVAARLPPLTYEQIAAFEQHLCAGLLVLLKADTWDETDPGRGGYFRTVAVDYDPDPLLTGAARQAGFKADLRLPIKTVMWINPGEVSVACGYGAPEEKLPLLDEE
jgi:hypothetical protein